LDAAENPGMLAQINRTRPDEIAEEPNMHEVTESEKDAFFEEVAKASATAVWCALATATSGGEPRVRMVHPTWEGDVLWVATGPETPKAKQMESTPWADVQWQVSPPNFIHIMARGRVEIFRDAATKKHVWETLDYDLKDFFSDGPEDPHYIAVKIVPARVELSEMFGSINKRVWRSA
jgi:general stress protein 26